MRLASGKFERELNTTLRYAFGSRQSKGDFSSLIFLSSLFYNIQNNEKYIASVKYTFRVVAIIR